MAGIAGSCRGQWLRPPFQYVPSIRVITVVVMDDLGITWAYESPLLDPPATSTGQRKLKEPQGT